MKVIALEEHYCPPEVNAAWNALPQSVKDDNILPLYDPNIVARLADMGDGRLRSMDDAGVDVQVLSLTTPATQALDPAQAVSLARLSNDVAAKTIKAHPDRFDAFATLPTSDVEASVTELHRCVQELGFKGALLASRTREKWLDHPDLFPVLQAAAGLKVPIYIHPIVPLKVVRDAYYSGFGSTIDTLFAAPGFGWHADTGIQALRLILAGTFDKLPDLQIILGHWGEVVMFYLDRIESLKRATKLEKSFHDYFRSNFYVTGSGIFSQKYLRQSIELVGIDRIMSSVDYPYIPIPKNEAKQFLINSRLSTEDQNKIASGNWERLASSATAPASASA